MTPGQAYEHLAPKLSPDERAALDLIYAAVGEATERAAALARVATGEVLHRYDGLCPDPVAGFDSRDPACPACQILPGGSGRS